MRVTLVVLAAALLGSASTALAQDTTLTLTGTVTDSVNGQPIPRVEIYLPNGSVTWSDTDGRFTISNVRRNEPYVFFRRIGYRKRALELPPSPSADRIDLGKVWFAPMYFALDTIRVEADLVRLNPKLSEFYRRKKSGMGQYLTSEQIFKRNPFATTDLLRTIAGVGVRCVSGPCTPVTYRRGTSQPCPMRVMLDGVPVRDFDIDLIPPGWIAGLEVYKSPTWTPLELGRGGCGTVVIWTGGER